MGGWLPILSGIVLVDLVLSGDNALVIGAVAAGIPVNLRWIAFLVGGGGAILLRILLTYSVTLLLGIPYIEVLGGVILVIITIRLLLQRDDGNGTSPKDGEEEDNKKKVGNYLKKEHLAGAIFTILIADVTMSLDNVIAIAALARNETLLLILGLIISIVLLLIGSALVSFIIDRFRWVLWIVAIILAFTSANMIVSSRDVFNLLPNEQPWWSLLVYGIVFATIAALTIFYPGFRWLRKRRSQSGG